MPANSLGKMWIGLISDMMNYASYILGDFVEPGSRVVLSLWSEF
jgi:hypothetical protein